MKKKIMCAATPGNGSNLIPACLHADHPFPVTRRQFMAAGLIPAVGYLTMPSLLGRIFSWGLGTEAMAAEMDTAYAEIHIAGGNLLNFHINGGGPGGVTAAGTGDWGSVTNWDNLGRSAAPTAATSNIQLGFPLNTGSEFTQTLFGAGGLSAAAIADTVVFAIQVQSNDDTTSNQFSLMDLVTKARAQTLATAVLPFLGVSAGSPSGGHNALVAPDPTVNKLIVTKVADLQGSIGLGANFSTISSTGQSAMLGALSALSGDFGARVAKFVGGSDFASLMQAATTQNKSLLANPPNVDPSKDTTAAGIWNTAAGASNSFTATSPASQVFFNMITGLSPASVAVISNGDYHNQPQTTTATLHSQTGEMLAKMLNHAAALKRKTMVAIMTDGAVTGQPSGPGMVGLGDNGQNGAIIVAFYNPGAGKSAYINGNSTQIQVGSLTANGNADANAAGKIGGSPSQAAAVVFYNYLATMGATANYGTLASSVLPTATAANYQVVQG